MSLNILGDMDPYLPRLCALSAPPLRPSPRSSSCLPRMVPALRTLAFNVMYRYVTDNYDVPEALPPLILAAAPPLLDTSNAAIGASHLWLAAFLLPPSSHRSATLRLPHTAHLGRPRNSRAARRLARPAGQDRSITDRTHALLLWTIVPSLRRLTLHPDLPIPLNPPRVGSALLPPGLCPAPPRWLQCDNLRLPRPSFCRLPTVSTILSLHTPARLGQSYNSMKRLTDDYDAPDARPALILAAAPSLRGLTLHLDPRTYVPNRAYPCAALLQTGPNPSPPRVLASPLWPATSATASTRSSAPDTLGTIRITSFSGPGALRLRHAYRALITASLAWLAPPLLPAFHWPLSAYVPGPTRRHTLALDAAYTTDDSAPDARSALVFGAAPSLREITMHIAISQTLGTMDPIRLPPFPLPPPLHLCEGSAANAEAPSGRRMRSILIATHTIHTRTHTASHPRAVKGVRPTKRSASGGGYIIGIAHFPFPYLPTSPSSNPYFGTPSAPDNDVSLEHNTLHTDLPVVAR
ncbi:hypothetical protein B0H14DRAFT_3473405 [Mycena olivaceomarginata]|nr:hypothetical protein B0H14DRAFT_3473405 [Mycena olivaceomarginata]